MKKTLFTLFAGAVLLGAIITSAAACGSSADEGTPCEQLSRQLCTLATACGASQTSNQCSFKEGDSQHGRNCNTCVAGMTRDVCGDTTKAEALFTSCLAAIDQATCDSTGGEDVIVLPEACKGLLDCKAGPCLN